MNPEREHFARLPPGIKLDSTLKGLSMMKTFFLELRSAHGTLSRGIAAQASTMEDALLQAQACAAGRGERLVVEKISLGKTRGVDYQTWTEVEWL